MYVKMVDDTINIAHMPDEEAISKGYKLAVVSEKPIVEDGYCAVSHWTEEADTMTQHWDVIFDPPDPDPDIDDVELLDILMGVTK